MSKPKVTCGDQAPGSLGENRMLCQKKAFHTGDHKWSGHWGMYQPIKMEIKWEKKS